MSWVICVSILFILLNKFLQYTTTYHEKWVAAFSPMPQIRIASQKYAAIVKERKHLHDENQSISAQDNYARWTKNNRKLSKLDSDLESLRQNLKQITDAQNGLLKKLKLVGITIPFLILKLWKGKHIVYDLPSKDTYPVIISGVWSQGWLYLGLLPLNILRGIDSSKKIANFGVSLGIWLWALQKTIDTIEFLLQQFLFQKEVDEPVKASGKAHVEKIRELTRHEVELD